MATAKKKSAKKSVKKTAKKSAAKRAPATITGYKTVSLDMASWRDPYYKFEVGKTYEIKDAPKDGRPCGPGLHFCQNKRDIPSYCDDEQDHILLEVRANKADILGQDSTKTRVSKLTIVKVLGKHTRYGDEYKKVAESVGKLALSKNFLKVSKTPIKKITDLAKVAMKGSGCKDVVITDNIFELKHFSSDEDGCNTFADRLNLSYDEYNDSPFEMPHFKDVDFGYDSIETGEAARQIVGSYLEAVADDDSKEEMTRLKAMVDLLALGALPVGQCKSSFLVFVPSTDPFKKLAHV